MGKMVGMAEFKANYTRLLRELEQDGEPITVTVRGKPVAVVNAASQEKPPKPPLASAFGMLRSEQYHFNDSFTPVFDMKEWRRTTYPSCIAAHNCDLIRTRLSG